MMRRSQSCKGRLSEQLSRLREEHVQRPWGGKLQMQNWEAQCARSPRREGRVGTRQAQQGTWVWFEVQWEELKGFKYEHGLVYICTSQFWDHTSSSPTQTQTHQECNFADKTNQKSPQRTQGSQTASSEKQMNSFWIKCKMLIIWSHLEM